MHACAPALSHEDEALFACGLTIPCLNSEAFLGPEQIGPPHLLRRAAREARSLTLPSELGGCAHII